MFNIPKLEKESFYIDSAIEAMQTFALNEKDRIDARFSKTPSTLEKSADEVRLNKRKDLELEKIRFLNDRLHISLKKLIKRFPRFRKLSSIYLKLIDTSHVRVKDIEAAVKKLQWIMLQIDELTKATEVKIKRAKTQNVMNFLMKKYLGKVNSYFSKNKQFFRDLEEARKFLNKLPVFEDVYTICIGGFPNVGKSTLMNKVTGAEVEIQNYPFTTKGLMFGYLKKGEDKLIQFIDTPGLLGRDKQNEIEQRAQIVLNEASDMIIFVLDFTESCGFGIKSQFRLLKKTRDLGMKMIVYLSKSDLFEDEEDVIAQYKTQLKKFKVFRDADELKAYVIEERSKSKKFDIKKINFIK